MSAAKLQHKRTEPYQQSIDEVLAALDADPRSGLSQAEVRARLEKFGRNELTAEKPVPAWRKFLAQFQDVLVILLLIATLISAGPVGPSPYRHSRLFLTAWLPAHRTIRRSTILEVTLRVIHQRNTSPILHQVQKI